MNSAHTNTKASNNTPGLCQHKQCFVPRGLHCGQKRSKSVQKWQRPCFANSSKPPETCVDLPEPVGRSPSCQIRRQLEQLYQLEQPQPLLWYTSPLLQEIARRGVSLEQAGLLPVQLCESPPEQSKLKDPDSKHKQEEYYANVGDAIRTLREETPFLFQQDLTCECQAGFFPLLCL